jgi:hydroxypyruvate isomerase
MQIMEGNIIQTLRNNMDAIGYIHMADVPGRFQPGTGELNFTNIFKAIRELNYQGVVGFEFEPTGRTEAVLKEVFKGIE